MLFQVSSQIGDYNTGLRNKIEISSRGTYSQQGKFEHTFFATIKKPTPGGGGYSALELWGGNGNLLARVTPRGDDVIVSVPGQPDAILRGALLRDGTCDAQIKVVDGKQVTVSTKYYYKQEKVWKQTGDERSFALATPVYDMKKLRVFKFDDYGAKKASQEPMMTEEQKQGQRYLNDNRFNQFYQGAKDEISKQAEEIGIEERKAKLIVGGAGLAVLGTLLYYRTNLAYFAGQFSFHKHYVGRAAMPDYAIKTNVELDNTLKKIIFDSDNLQFREKMNQICPTAAQKETFLRYVKSNILKTLYEPGLEAEFDSKVENKLSNTKKRIKGSGSKPANDIMQSEPKNLKEGKPWYHWRQIPGLRTRGRIFAKTLGIKDVVKNLPKAIFTAIEGYGAELGFSIDKNHPGYNQNYRDALILAQRKSGAGTPPYKEHEFSDSRMNKQVNKEIKSLSKKMAKLWKAEFNHQMWVDMKGVSGFGILPVQYLPVVEHHLNAGRNIFWTKMYKEKLISKAEFKTLTEGKYDTWKDVIKSTNKQAAIVKKVTGIAYIYNEWKAGKSGSYKLLIKELGYATWKRVQPSGLIDPMEVKANEKIIGKNGVYLKSAPVQLAIAGMLLTVSYMLYEFIDWFITPSAQEKKTGVVYSKKTAERVISTKPVYTGSTKIEPSWNEKAGSYVYTAWILPPDKTEGGTVYNQAKFECKTKDGDMLFTVKLNIDNTMTTWIKGVGEKPNSSNTPDGITGASVMLFLDPSQKLAMLKVYTSTGGLLNNEARINSPNKGVRIEWNPAFDDPKKKLEVNKSYERPK